MNGRRQKTQLSLAFTKEGKSEAPKAPLEGTESLVARQETQSQAGMERLMEQVVERENLKEAFERVKANKGSPGVDGLKVDELLDYLNENWSAIREKLLCGTYKPAPVRRVEIPKPDGGKRKLGIPTVLDRFIQQAILQVLQSRWDRTFSEHSFGFRPGKSAHQAVERAQRYITEGNSWVVDIDLEKFFDRVNHDKLMGLLAKRITDKRLLKLIRAFLNAGVMENGLTQATDEGTPQGGPLSPLLSNVMLDELDRELERRGHRFVRYADDCNIYVCSERAGQRVMESIGNFITGKLKLKINGEKSAVARPWKRKFLGFSFTPNKKPKRRISPKALKRFKERIRELTRRTRGISFKEMIRQLSIYLKGWRGYFGFCQTPSVLETLDSWIRRRLRCVIWKHWKRGRKRFAELVHRGVRADLAAQTAGSSHGPWRISDSPAMHYAFPNAFFTRFGLPSLLVHA